LVLQSHGNGVEARYPIDNIIRNYKPCDGLKPWMRLGVHLRAKGEAPEPIIESEAIIVAVQGNNVVIREGEPGNSSARSFEAKELEQLFEPVGVAVPRWLASGSRIVLRSGDQVYEVKDLDTLGGSFTAFKPAEPTRLERYNLLNFETHWRPFSTLHSDLHESKPKRMLAPPVIPVSTIPTAPDWLKPGSLLRPQNRHMRRSFWVMSIHPDRGMCRIQRIAKFEPLQMEAEWEELAYEVAEKSWEPLNADGSPLSEKKCPHCGAWGGRNAELEEATSYKIRAYHCLAGHRWTFIDGGSDDGKPAPPTRFQRELDI
jgi:hypothetical protein